MMKRGMTDEKQGACHSGSFYINPKFESYPSDSEFYPGTGGVRFGIDVRVYSKGGTRYMWRRTA